MLEHSAKKLEDSNIRTVYNCHFLPYRQPRGMETDPKTPDGCRGALVLSSVLAVLINPLAQEVSVVHEQNSQRPQHFSTSLRYTVPERW
jgi:hypothetical protein